MTITVPALLTKSAGASFERGTIERRELGDDDVLIDIAFAGICHSDIHQAREEWGKAIFPMVPGHEIAGTIAAVGSAVDKHAVGDHVGIGCFVDSCGECENCTAGNEQFCVKGNVATYNGREYSGEPTYGGYSTQIVAKADYVLKVPASIPLDQAAPLLCAGITTYSPLARFGAGPGKKVAVVGMGGLGHMAVKLAAAMGAEVSVISQTMSKEEDGKRFGADHYYALSDSDTFGTLRGTFDLIICTISADLPIDKYLSTLAINGAMVFVGLPPGAQQLRVGSLIGGNKTLAGSNIGGIPETQEMLDFCAEHNIGAEIETIGADEVTEAYDRIVKSDVRYRFVIDTKTIPAS
ncbi:MAG: NAD(P)-dependent alcohol dehydrogenase [Nakamurella sp.]